MKTHPYFKFLFLFAVLAAVSCSKKEDPFVEQGPALVLELKSDAGNGELEVVSIDQVVNFTFIGNDDQDYTSLANILVNDVEIEGSSYTFTELGNYQVKAIYDDVVSNVLTFEVLAETERALTVSVTKAMRNQTVTFGLLEIGRRSV